MAGLTLENVSKVYPRHGGDVRAVSDLNLSIDDRELIVLVGPSGCGKTTTLRLIAGLEDATAGVIRIGDQVVNRVTPKDRDVAMVFQNYALYPHMTVYKNMAFGLKMRRVAKAQIKRQVHETAERLGLAQLLDRKPGELSGGECQRVALGRAIVRKPRLFLFDEPLSNLDTALRLEMRSQIKALQRNLETTAVYVTHDQEEAMTLGDRLVVMHDGVVQQVDPPMTVYQRPINRFVASLIGSPPMNFFDARLEVDGSQAVCKGGFGAVPIQVDRESYLASFNGRNVVLGIRPEHLHVNDRASASGGSDAGRRLARIGVATVQQVEPLGDRRVLRLSLSNGKAVIAKGDADIPAEPGATVDLSFEAANLHVFAATEGGERLA